VSFLRRSSTHSTLVLLLALVAVPTAAQEREAPTTNPDAASYITPPPAVQRILETNKNYATLNYMSPDGDHFLIPVVNELSTLDLMSRTTYRLAELELRPETDRLWHLDTYGIYDFRFYSLSARRLIEVDLPDGSFASDFTWSPDGSQVAFLAHLPDHTEVWTAEASSGRTRSLSSARVLATVGTSARGQGAGASNMLQWTPEGTIITLLVPSDRGDEPARNPVPSGPVVRRTRGEPTRAPTYPNLLEDAHDEVLFEHYTRSQIAELGDGSPKPIGEPGMYQSISLSPDGLHILATRMERPFSYITAYRSFPNKTVILERDGTEIAVLDDQPLREGRSGFGFGGGGGGNGPRAFAWRPDGAGLAYLERAPRDPDGEADAPRPDRIKLATAPFDLEAGQVIAESDDAIRSVNYSLDGQHAFATVSKSGETGIAHFDLETSGAASMLLAFHDTDDPTELPGGLLTAETANGLDYAVVSSDGESAYLEGPGYSAQFTPQPFVDRVAISGGTTERVFEGATDSFDRPLVPLDPDMTRVIASRESVTDFPDSYLWTADDGWGDNLTNNVDPFPEVTATTRIDFEFERRDGLKVQGRVSMPVGWQDGDDKVPAIFWTYPREYEEADGYLHSAIQGRNHNAFTHISSGRTTTTRTSRAWWTPCTAPSGAWMCWTSSTSTGSATEATATAPSPRPTSWPTRPSSRPASPGTGRTTDH